MAKLLVARMFWTGQCSLSVSNKYCVFFTVLDPYWSLQKCGCALKSTPSALKFWTSLVMNESVRICWFHRCLPVAKRDFKVEKQSLSHCGHPCFPLLPISYEEDNALRRPACCLRTDCQVTLY